MSGLVDVLAEMQADIDALEQRVLDGEFTLSRGYDKVNRLRGLRAAVAELIEAAKRTRPFLQDEANNFEDDGSNEPLECLRNLDAALARVGGAE